MKDIAAIVLAAGKGTRMKSKRAKVLHPIAGLSMVEYPVGSLMGAGIESVVVVVGHQSEAVRESLAGYPSLRFALQEEQLGTGHAVMCAMELIGDEFADVLILCGDIPLLKPETLRGLVETHRRATESVSILTARIRDPFGYGRVITQGQNVLRIVEEADATSEEKRIDLINSGIYCIKADIIRGLLADLKTDNAQGEFYLTDLVEQAYKTGRPAVSIEVEEAEEILGVNSRADLALAESTIRSRKRMDLMLSGVTIQNPGSVMIDERVRIGPDTLICPNNYLVGDTTVGEGCTIEPNCFVADSKIADGVRVRCLSVIEESRVAEGCSIGPFAHLRPGADIRRSAKVGNFVEIKKSVIGEGSKVSHLTYVGDTEVGKDVNVGAGTITCNYDGKNKHKTIIGDRAFIGSNTELVAPVRVGSETLIGAGSTITKDVPDGYLAVARARQKNLIKRK